MQNYSEDTLEALEAHAQAHGAGLVTTEKDWVRLSPPWRAKVLAWPVRARFQDEAALDRLLVRRRPLSAQCYLTRCIRRHGHWGAAAARDAPDQQSQGVAFA